MSKPHIKDTEEITVMTEKSKVVVPVNTNKKASSCTILLTIIQGNDINFGKIFAFSCDVIRIGRDKSNTIVLDDRKVSKYHCEITMAQSMELVQFVITDLDSTNGTYINCEPVRQRILSSGDKITVGDTIFRFNYNDDVEEEYHSKLFNFAATDALTGLYNRRYVLNELESHFKIAKRNNRIFSIVVLDIDDFKVINDTHGHPAGDEYLKKIAFIINSALREQDISGRLGGEEFLIILPETDIQGAFILANRIREQIEEMAVLFENNPIKATISAGVTDYSPDTPPEKSATLLQLADKAMYAAKAAGKNQVKIAKI